MIQKVKLNEYLFYLAYIPWLFAWLLTYTWLKDYLHPYAFLELWNYIGSLILIFKILITNKFDKRYIIFSMFIVFVGLVVIQNNANASFVFFVILCLMSSQNIDAKQIIKFTLYLQAFILFFVISSVILGVAENIATIQYVYSGQRIRYNLGFKYCTDSANFYLSIILEYIYLKSKEATKIFNILIFLLVDFYLYKMTNTNEAFFLVIIAIILNLIFNKCSIYKVYIFRIWIKIQYFFAAALSFIFCYAYSKDNALAIFVNKMINQRIVLAYEGLLNWGITLFGTSVVWISGLNEYNYIDNSFINIIICYGAIIFIFVLFMYYFIGREAVFNQDIGLGIALIIWMVHSIMNPQLFLLWFNPFLFLFRFKSIKKK